MSIVGSLIFCVDCGNLLDNIVENKDTLSCEMCHRQYDAAPLSRLEVVTQSASDAFPSTLRSKRSAVKTDMKDHEVEEGAIIEEECPECGNQEMTFYTLQLRSADEGATVFYTCTRCGYKFRQAN